MSLTMRILTVEHTIFHPVIYRRPANVGFGFLMNHQVNNRHLEIAKSWREMSLLELG